jgi:hypothetical protein
MAGVSSCKSFGMVGLLLTLAEATMKSVTSSIDVECTREAMRILKQAMQSVSQTLKGPSFVEATTPLWNAANHLLNSLPREVRLATLESLD